MGVSTDGGQDGVLPSREEMDHHLSVHVGGGMKKVKKGRCMIVEGDGVIAVNTRIGGETGEKRKEGKDARRPQGDICDLFSA